MSPERTQIFTDLKLFNDSSQLLVVISPKKLVIIYSEGECKFKLPENYIRIYLAFFSLLHFKNIYGYNIMFGLHDDY